MSPFTLACLTLATVFTISCSSSDNTSTPEIGNSFETTPERLGFISVTDSPYWEDVSVFAEFNKVDAQGLKRAHKLYGLDLAMDSCNYWTDEELTAYHENPSERISAGDKLSLYVGNALSMEVHIESDTESHDHLIYQAQSEEYQRHRLPVDSVISIPGHEFPAMSDISIPNVEPFTDLSISENGVTVDPELIDDWSYLPNKDTNIRWQAGTVDSSFVRITAALYTSFDEDMQINFVNCIAKDDGDFSFPETALSYVENKTIANLSISRESLTTYSQGSASLIIIHDSDSE